MTVVTRPPSRNLGYGVGVASTRRSEPTTPRRAAIEASVLAATETLLREGCAYSELNIEKIATRAGLSRTAFYFYFRDKRELLMRVAGGVADALYAEAERWWSGEGDGRESLAKALGNIAGLWREHIPLLRAVVEASTFDEEIEAFWRGIVDSFITATRRRIESEQASGRVPADLPAGGMAFALCWATERTLYQGLMQRAYEDSLVDALVAMWSRAVYGE